VIADFSAGTERRVAVLTHTGRTEAVDAATRLVGGLLAAGVDAAVPAEDRPVLEERLGRPITELMMPRVATAEIDVAEPLPYELMVVLGGDGTILRAAEWVMTSDIPLLGVNLGHVGFLAEAESSEIDSIVAQIVACDYAVEERFTIEVTARVGGEPTWCSYAINEVCLEKAARERMVELVVEIDGRPLSRWACDGMLVSTPTGSTAYAFSAGGPVIWPGVDALLVVPLSAHALFARPLVLGPSSVVVVELLDVSPTSGLITCDGRRSTEFQPGMTVEVVRGRHRLRLARLSQSPFSDRLVRKFGLRVEGWRGLAELENGPDAMPPTALATRTNRRTELTA
jgi:NAD+ kinase